MLKILLFTGAGMSVPMGLPAAIGFADTIKKCNPDLLRLMKSHLNEGADDIEKILYLLDEFIDGSSFVRHIMNQYAGNTGYQPMIDVMGHYINYAKGFQQTVKHDIFNILRNYDDSKAATIYFNIIQAFKHADKDFSLSVFTTNYDLIFEEVILENSEIFETGIYRFLLWIR